MPLRSSKLALTLLAALAAMLLALPAAASALPGSPPLRVMEPGKGAWVKGGSARLEVRTGPGVGSFKAWLGNRKVTGSFHRQGRLWTARVPVGPALRPGVNYLYVRAVGRSGKPLFSYRRFVVVRHDEALLGGLGLRHGLAAAPLAASVSSRPSELQLRASLNGNELHSAFDRSGAVHRAELGAGHGLHQGRNVLRVTALTSGGRYDVESRVFEVARDRPLAGAGPDRLTFAGHGIRLAGKASSPAAGEGPLSYRWQLLGKDPGAKLLRADSPSPTFVPGRFGTSRVRLTVSQGGVSSSDVTAVAVAPDDPPIGVSFEARGYQGLWIDGKPIRTAEGSTISYAVLERKTRAVLTAGVVDYSAAGVEAVQKAIAQRQGPEFVVAIAGHGEGRPELRRTLPKLLEAVGAGPLSAWDRRVLASDAPFGFGAIGIPGVPGSAFVNIGRKRPTSAISGAITGYLQVRSPSSYYGFVYGDDAGFETSQSAAPGANTMFVGGELFSAKLPPSVPASSGFHLVAFDPGTLKQPINVAYATNSPSPPATQQRETLALAARIEQALAAGNLIFLQSIGTPSPTTPAWSQLIDDVEAAGGNRAVVGTIGAGGYALVGGGGENALQVIERPTKFAILFRGAGTRDLPGNVSAAEFQQVLEGLSTIGPGNVLVRGGSGQDLEVEFIRERGNRALPGLNVIGRRAAAPGASSGAMELKIVREGGLPADYPQAEVSGALTGRQARLFGTLARSRDSDFRVALAGDQRVAQTGLVGLAFQAPQPFPPFDTEAKRKANAYIAVELNLFDKSDVRRNYYRDYLAPWEGKLAKLQTLCYSNVGSQLVFTCEDKGFSADDFNLVRDQLKTEIAKVIDVKALIGHMREPFDKEKVKAYVDLVNIEQKIEASINLERAVSTSAISAEILGQMIGAAGGIAPEGAAAVVSALSEGLGKVGTMLGPDGLPVLGQLQAKAGQLGPEVLARYSEASDSLVGLGMILVSDPAKLSAAAAKTSGEWHWDPKTEAMARMALDKGSKRWFYGELLPIATWLYQLDPYYGDGTTPLTNARSYTCRNGARKGLEPFRYSGDATQDYQVTGFTPSGTGVTVNRQVRALGGTSPNWDAREPDVQPLPNALLEPLFKPLVADLSSPNLGLYKAQFYSSRYFQLAPRWAFLRSIRECGT